MRKIEEIVADADMMRKAKAIREWLSELSGLIPRLNEDPNPYYSSTLDGLALVHYYGGPSGIATPFGKWSATGGGCLKNSDWFEEARQRLGLVEIMPELQNHQGCFGPVHAITKDLDGNPLPKTVWNTRYVGSPGIKSDRLFSSKDFKTPDDAIAYAQKLGVTDRFHPGFLYPAEYEPDSIIYSVGTEILEHYWTKMKQEIGFKDWYDERKERGEAEEGVSA